MSLESNLENRSGGQCELCTAKGDLKVYEVEPQKTGDVAECAYLCPTCTEGVSALVDLDENHFRCLNDAMWSEHSAVKVLSWRLLKAMQKDWTNDLLDMIYLTPEEEQWAKAGYVDPSSPKHRDANGVELKAGDNVVLIKDLNVKGAGFTAKRGTAVKRISLDHDNVNHIEGKVEGQHIVILTQYVKKN